MLALGGVAGAGAGLRISPLEEAVGLSEAPKVLRFALLGDLHFDRLHHHDMAWLKQHKPNDVRQVENYSRITREVTPRLLEAVGRSAKSAQASFVLQVGDLVEGLCGSAELAALQNREAVDFVKEALPDLPFVFTKGNHDVTGDGAVEAYEEVFYPFAERETAAFAGRGVGRMDQGSYAVQHGEALFCFFDAYDRSSLDWLEATLEKRTAYHCFVVVHPPVVPYGARATWYLYEGQRRAAEREKLLTLLGKNYTIVLGGHIHRYCCLSRDTPGGGRMVQLAVSSIISSPEVKVRTELSGVEKYNGDQIEVEPRHSPDTAEERRAVYKQEAPLVRSFDYADLPGHAMVEVKGQEVRANIYRGVSQQLWKKVNLSALLERHRTEF